MPEGLHIEWRESGIVLNAETSYELGSQGLHCRIALPIAD